MFGCTTWYLTINRRSWILDATIVKMLGTNRFFVVGQVATPPVEVASGRLSMAYDRKTQRTIFDYKWLTYASDYSISFSSYRFDIKFQLTIYWQLTQVVAYKANFSIVFVLN